MTDVRACEGRGVGGRDAEDGPERNDAAPALLSAPEKRVVGRPFPKGVSGNPGGRARGPKLSTLIARELERPTVAGSPLTKAQIVAEKLVNLAQAGDMAAIREVLDRLEGKAVARSEAGEPGAFEDLAEKSTEELRAMLRAVT